MVWFSFAERKRRRAIALLLSPASRFSHREGKG